MKILVYGAGMLGQNYPGEFGKEVEILAFVDDDINKQGRTIWGHKIISPEEIRDYNFDKIFIAIDDNSLSGTQVFTEVLNQLLDMDIPFSKLYAPPYIVNKFPSIMVRHDFIKEFAVIAKERDIEGAAAECGVFRGCFAGFINLYMPDRKLYLFDTFEGFDNRDIEKDTHMKTGYEWDAFSHGDEAAALLRCWHRDNVIVKKGYVPDTFQGVEDEIFAFVNLDMDLYDPLIEGLRFFAPKMSKRGGVILLHEYYDKNYPGAKAAVTDFAKEYPVTLVPIGDNCSIAVIPHN